MSRHLPAGVAPKYLSATFFMSFFVNALFSLSVGFSALIGWVRYKKSDPAFFPFLLLVTLGFLHEILSILLLKAGYSNAASYNLFSLFEALLINWQFSRWQLFEKHPQGYHRLQCLMVTVWLCELALQQSLLRFFSYFIIGYSFLIVLMSITLINRTIFRESRSLLRNSRFLICMGLIIYFIYAVLVETFWLFGLTQSQSFRVGIYQILSYINLFTNLIYALAFLWIPMKPRYIMQS
ncbi:MAG: hypothetical protein JWP69_1352 [Flaviaesturariibacter sp.]|nr:hypothetical protein [Flaviaesturariibacter sp.]